MTNSLQHIAFEAIDGTETTLGDYLGQVLLVVNVASKCGLTPQYEALERLDTAGRARGFTVLGFPANDFAGQEPGTNEEIAEFCQTTFSVRFPVFAKISVVGEGQHPLYQALTTAAPPTVGDPDAFRAQLRSHGVATTAEPDVLWNFEKFLIGRDGTVKARFAPDVTPDDPRLLAAVEQELSTAPVS